MLYCLVPLQLFTTKILFYLVEGNMIMHSRHLIGILSCNGTSLLNAAFILRRYIQVETALYPTQFNIMHNGGMKYVCDSFCRR